jgi:hypothetical protein
MLAFLRCQTVMISRNRRLSNTIRGLLRIIRLISRLPERPDYAAAGDHSGIGQMKE